MTKYIITGVGGNFGSSVAEIIQSLLPNEELLFTVPKTIALK